MQVRPEDTRTEISCRAAKGLILFLRREHGTDALSEVFTQACLPIEYVNVGNNWLSFAAFNRLLDALVAVTGDEEAPFKSGQLTSEPSTFGPVRVVGKRFLSIHGVYRIMATHSEYFVKICDWTMISSAPVFATNSVSQRLTASGEPVAEHSIMRSICWRAAGSTLAMKSALGGSSGSVSWLKIACSWELRSRRACASVSAAKTLTPSMT